MVLYIFGGFTFGKDPDAIGKDPESYLNERYKDLLPNGLGYLSLCSNFVIVNVSVRLTLSITHRLTLIHSKE
jgi:hypothetical protein